MDIVKNNKGLTIIITVVGLFLVMVVPKLVSSGGYKITTPKEDGAYCWRILEECNSLKDLERATDKIGDVFQAYEDAVEEGEITMPQYKSFLLAAPNQTEIENRQAYFLGFGPN